MAGPDAADLQHAQDREGHPGHYHAHPDYQGRMHTHLHAHNGDASHAPGTFTHQHGTASVQPQDRPDTAAAAGIAAERAEQLAADPGGPAGLPDEQLYTRLFGEEPG